MRCRSIAVFAALAAALAGCASEPAPRLYVLGGPAIASGGAAGSTAVQVQPVLIPDYLDTIDILLRIGPHEVKASRTGRWSERLSAGIAHALLTSLAARLPQDRVSLAQPEDAAASQIQVTVDALDLSPDGRCVLTAHWTVLRGGNVGGSEGQGSFVGEATAPVDDAALVAAMAQALDRMAARIAITAGA